MSADAAIALVAMAYLLAKHALGDFVLQTPYQWRNKGRFGHPGGVLHSLIHAALTAPVLLLVTVPMNAGLAVLGAEFLLHYHVDWLKERIVHRKGWTSGESGYWRALGLDQLAHGLTYVAIVTALLLLRA